MGLSFKKENKGEVPFFMKWFLLERLALFLFFFLFIARNESHFYIHARRDTRISQF
jgi:hypothetical protein